MDDGAEVPKITAENLIEERSAEKKRRKRKVMTDKKRQEIAVALYQPDAEGRLKTPHDVAEEMGYAVATVRTAAREAIRRNLVRVHIVERPLIDNREHDLERRLSRLFHVKALVMRTDDSHPSQFGDVQRRLGQLMGHWIIEDEANVVFRDEKSLIVLEAGRGVYGAVTAIRHYMDPTKPLPARGIGSLTGSIGQKGVPTAKEDSTTQVDADPLAAALLTSMAGGQLFQVAQGLTASSPEEARRVRSRLWFSTDSWGKPPPTTAILGLGVLNEHHRFHEALHDTDVAPCLQPIKNSLRTLYGILSDHRLQNDDFCPVMGLVHRLHLVPLPSGLKDQELASRLEAQRSELRALIDDVNAHLLTVPSEKLSEVQNLFVIAGGGNGKTAALHYVLTTGRQELGLNLYAIATDEKTALKLEAWGR